MKLAHTCTRFMSLHGARYMSEPVLTPSTSTSTSTRFARHVWSRCSLPCRAVLLGAALESPATTPHSFRASTLGRRRAINHDLHKRTAYRLPPRLPRAINSASSRRSDATSVHVQSMRCDAMRCDRDPIKCECIDPGATNPPFDYWLPI